ncbi:hypothetical protein RRG08_023979 [Elysia crispata]|uniref:Uncharacterized protein n=1 Tax=Elysia crispata TaxID=231223 RepID=A0AAE0YM96_9GAST|nr:hypothetical protein RRG08_023979 [Elysia crispata]
MPDFIPPYRVLERESDKKHDFGFLSACVLRDHDVQRFKARTIHKNMSSDPWRMKKKSGNVTGVVKCLLPKVSSPPGTSHRRNSRRVLAPHENSQRTFQDGQEDGRSLHQIFPKFSCSLQLKLSGLTAKEQPKQQESVEKTNVWSYNTACSSWRMAAQYKWVSRAGQSNSVVDESALAKRHALVNLKCSLSGPRVIVEDNVEISRAAVFDD